MGILWDAWLEAEKEGFALATNDGLGEARRLSSGPYSQDELTRRGHPFAVRHGAPQLDPGLINIQTGDFLRAWRKEGPEPAPDADMVSRIINEAPEADYLNHGTRFMFQRPVAQRTEFYMSEEVPKRLKASFQKLSRRTIKIT